MASIVNKRQQARNERALQDLIKTVSGNDRCADCYARNPGWASWSLGVFLCVRCAALHRKLGTHISKVKSLSMDAWSSDQVENMKRVGNVASNRIYNPRNIKPVVPIDEDEVDPAVERYIRQKYQHRTLGTEKTQPALTHRTGSSTSTDDTPPPPPPKPAKHFGASVRASSSQYPGTQTDSPLPALPTDVSEAHRISKVPDGEISGRRRSFDLKLERMKELGFTNAGRNATVLQGLDGNLEKSIQTLVRLGEGSPSLTSSFQQVGLQPTPNTLQRAPTPTAPSVQSTGSSGQQGFSFTSGIATSTQATPSPTNPYNPFLAPQQNQQQQQAPLDQYFSNMSVSSQPLFPNSTETWRQPPDQQTNPFLKSYTPPMSPSSYQQQQQQHLSHIQAPVSSYGQPVSNPMDTAARSNPFLRTSRSQNFATSSNPFYQSPQSTGSTSMDQQHFIVPPVPSIPQWASSGKSASLPHVISQQPQPLAAQPFAMQQQEQLFSSPGQSPTTWENPQQSFFNPTYQQPPQNNVYYQHQPQQQHTYPGQYQQQGQQQPARYDKNSLLALYNYPHLAPAKPAVSSPLASDPSSPVSTGAVQQQPQQQQKRMSSMPLVGSQATNGGPRGNLNPFTNMTGQKQGPGSTNGALAHVSQESVDFAGLMNGRHSPDAFSGLSARAV